MRSIGIGGVVTCHTTGYAGPHPADRRVKLAVSRELGKPERGEETVRQSELHRRRVGSRSSVSNFETGSRSPEVSSTAFDAQPLDLHSVPLMDVGFATSSQLARTLPVSYPVLVHRLAPLLRASFRPRLAASVISPLRFAVTSRPSRCEEDLHLLAVDHARHTTAKGPRLYGALFFVLAMSRLEQI